MQEPQIVVRSWQNSRLKQIRRYLNLPQSPESPWVAVEGPKTILELARSHPVRLLVAAEAWPEDALPSSACPCLRVSETIFRKLSQVESPTGIMAFFDKPDWTWEELPGYLLYLDRLQDPGNLGTLIRCAAAAGQAGIVSSPDTVSRFNSKAVRASSGTLFRLPMRESERPERLIDHGYSLMAADPEASEVLFSCTLDPPLAIVIGNEGQGISHRIQKLAQRRVRIPVEPEAPSLNAAIAGALFLFEIRRRSEFP